MEEHTSKKRRTEPVVEGRQRPSLESYSVGWIAALPHERAAAISMLDERYDMPEFFHKHQSEYDTNEYSWGRIHSHKVVIASMPAGDYGTTITATTVLAMRFSLPQLRVCLLVGTGAGIHRPGEYDIRLGDVVVSQPQGTSGGVIQYDFQKVKTGRLERIGFLSRPPDALRNALSKLQAEHMLEDSKMPKILADARARFPRMRRDGTGNVHQGVDNDRLFKSTYDHVRGADCQACDKSQEIEREARKSTSPVIHYGIIASGNSLVRSAAERDRIVGLMQEPCICFEMEAAGMMNSFPALVVRGISSYADSHKNDQWQHYAAMTAAAFTKEFLSYVRTSEVQAEARINEVLENGK